MISVPLLDASLNALSALFLYGGSIFIRKKNKALHRASMLSAVFCSTIFLISYITYHAKHGTTAFKGQGPIRIVYFVILVSHTILAALVPVLAARVLYLAFREQFERHKRLARIAFPVWMYVSVTGVLIYWFLYVL